jgi:hypothetical protein
VADQVAQQVAQAMATHQAAIVTPQVFNYRH